MLYSKTLFGLVASAVVLVSAGAEEPRSCHTNVAKGSEAIEAAFDRLKALVGDWQLASPKDDAEKGRVAARYHLTAGGSVLVETLFPGGDKEMVSLYHRDGDQIALTHYCMAGNQPTLRAKGGVKQDELAFEFAGGTNLNPSKDMHMHNYRVRFVDADHLHGEWDYYTDGKSAGKHVFDLVRKK